MKNKNWDTTVLVQDLHQDRRNGTMTLQEVASVLADRLERNRYYKAEKARYDAPGECMGHVDDGLMAIVWELRDLADDPSEDQNELVEYYDGILEDLYDFGDQGKRIWVKSL